MSDRLERLAHALRRIGVDAAPESGISDRVGEIYVMLTYDCNLRCRHCPFWGERGFCKELSEGAPETLRVEDVVRFVREAARFRPSTVTLSGGEPLLWPMFGSLIAELSELGIGIDVTTNATLLDGLSDEELGRLDQVNVSLDGPPLVLKRVGRGGEPTLDKALAGMRRANAVKAARGRPRLRLLSVITGEGAGHLEEMLDYFRSEGIELDSILLQHRMFMDAATAREHQAALAQAHGTADVGIWEGLVGESGGVDAPALEAELSRISSKYRSVMISPRFSSAELERFYADGSFTPEKLADFCLAPWANVMLGPYGDVWLCPGFAIGNVHGQSFEAIYNGEIARSLRRRIAETGIFPGCRACWHLDNYR